MAAHRLRGLAQLAACARQLHLGQARFDRQAGLGMRQCDQLLHVGIDRRGVGIEEPGDALGRGRGQRVGDQHRRAQGRFQIGGAADRELRAERVAVARVLGAEAAARFQRRLPTASKQ